MKKKWLIGLMVLCLSFATIAFVGCGENDNGDNTNTEQGGGNENDDTQGGDNSNDSTPTPETPDGAEENEDIITPVIAEGLEYEESEDGTYYIVTGIGACEDTDIIIPSTHNGKPVKEIGDFAFDFCRGLTSVVIADNIESIGIASFIDCRELTRIDISSNVKVINLGAFAYCNNLVNINVSDNNQNYKDIEGNLYTKDGKVLMQYATGKTETFFAIPDSVATIDSCSFAGCKSLANITIPSSVENINEDAFYECNRLVEIVNKSAHITVEKGEDSNGCLGKHALAIYNSEDVFTRTKLSNDNGYIVYADGDEKILVGYVGKETALVLPTYITRIHQHAFYDCINLTSVVIGDNVTTIEEFAFNDCLGIMNVIIGEGVTYIGEYAFSSCRGLTSIIIPKNVVAIGENAFNGCARLVEIYNKSSLEIVAGGFSYEVGYYAKKVYTEPYISKLSTTDNGYVLYTDEDEIGIIAYRGEEKFLMLPSNGTYINQSAFEGCDELTGIVIADGVTVIGEDAFRGCSNLTNITIPNSVLEMEYGVFYGCEKLTSITFNGTMAQWGEMKKDGWWNEFVPAEKVVCSDGEVNL